MTKRKIQQIAESLGWTVTWDKNKGGSKSITFSQCSPAGLDFNVVLEYENLGEIKDKLSEYCGSYDPSYEAYLWLDESGHGKNGAPYDMFDVYSDMEDCEGMVRELLDALMDEEE